MSLLKKFVQLGLKTLVENSGVQEQSTHHARISPPPRQSGASFKLDRMMGSKPHPRTGHTISYYDALYAKITVFGPGEVYGQRFDLTRQPEGKWIVLSDTRGNRMPIKVCRQGNDALVEWLL